MLTIGGSTFYTSLCGKVPRVLPSTEQVDYPGGAVRPSPGLIARAHSPILRDQPAGHGGGLSASPFGQG
eukprot:9568147-Lingulodinium_polyedra.AAC.1